MAAQNQYPMNFMQQQVPQQGGMGQPGMATSGHAPHGGMSEQQRLWQQMQEQGRTPQMADFMRNHLPQQQSQPQPQQLNQNPSHLQQSSPFANLSTMTQANGMQQNAAAFAAMRQQAQLQGQQSQQQHSQQTGQQPPNLQAGGALGMQLNPQMLAALQQARSNNNGNQALNMSRQIGLLNRAQKQQPQNGPQNFGQQQLFPGAQQGINQLPFQNGVFQPKADESRPPGIPLNVNVGQPSQPQPQHLVQPGPQQGNPTHNVPAPAVLELVQKFMRSNDGTRDLSSEEIRQKLYLLKGGIDKENRNLQAMKQSLPETSEQVVAQSRLVQQRELVFRQILAHIQQQNGQLPNGQNINSGMPQNAMSMSFPQQQQQLHQQHTGGQQMPGSTNWMNQNGVGQAPDSMVHTQSMLGLQQQQAQQQSQTNAQQHSNQHPSLASPFNPNLAPSQPTPIPRSGPTPQQNQQVLAFLQQQRQQTSPHPPTTGGSIGGMGALGAMGGPKPPMMGTPIPGQQSRPREIAMPPIPRDKFAEMLQESYKRTNTNPDRRLLAVGNRQIDLYQLHIEVLHFGGVANVKRHNLWNVITSKLSLQSDGQRTSEQIAEQLHNVYAQFLEAFEMQYMTAMMKQSMGAGVGDQRNQANQPIPIPQQGSPAMQAPQQHQSAIDVHPPTFGRFGQMNPHIMYKLSLQTVEQIRASGVNEELVNYVDANRQQIIQVVTDWQRRFQLAQQQRQQMQGVPSGQSQQQQQQPPIHQANFMQPQTGSMAGPPVPFRNHQQQQQPQQPIQPQAQQHRLAGPLQTQGSPPMSMQGPAMGIAPGMMGQPGPSQPLQPGLAQSLGIPPEMLNYLKNVQKPSSEQIREGMAEVVRMRENWNRSRVAKGIVDNYRQLSEMEKIQFRERFDTVCKNLVEMDRYLGMFFAATKDVRFVTEVVGMLDDVSRQRNALQAPNPGFILETDKLAYLVKHSAEARRKVLLVLSQLRFLNQEDQKDQELSLARQQHQMMPQQHPLAGQTVEQAGPSLPPQTGGQASTPASSMMASSPAHMTTPNRPPTAQPQMAPHQQAQNLRPPPNRTPQIPPARPPSVQQAKKNQLASSPAAPIDASSPHPSTPVTAAAHTPSHLQGSPSTPKSPKTKAPKQPKKSRRKSNAAQTPAVTAATPSESVHATASPAHPQDAPSPAENSRKRPREDDTPAASTSATLGAPTPAANLTPSAAVAGGDETPTKKLKTEWDDTRDNEPLKSQMEADSIKTPAQAAQFYSESTQALGLTDTSNLPPDLQDTLAALIKIMGPGLDNIPDSALGGGSDLGAGPSTAGDKSETLDESFLSFLDFSSYQDGKPETPDLVPHSSTNTSPESGAGSESEHAAPPGTGGSAAGPSNTEGSSSKAPAASAGMDATEPRVGVFDGSDPLRLGFWGEIDGGESAYYSGQDMWKWDTVPSSAGENSWPIST